jgi:indolepyruvate ferredoxin oxidoreductase
MDVARAGVTRAVVNTHQQMTGEFTRNADFRFPAESLRDTITAGSVAAVFVDATRLATALLGDSIATNMFMLGHAWQQGLVPISSDAINRAIELNGTAVKMNQAAFLWGRRTAVDQAAVERLIAPKTATVAAKTATLDELIAHRVEFLTAYQSRSYAARYQALVEKVRAAELKSSKARSGLSEAVARYYFKLLAYKDEYEVARLYTDGVFLDKIRAQFEGDYKLNFYLAPPMWAKRDAVTGELRKGRYGQWMLAAFRVLARMRFLRGTPLDLFGYSQERRAERQLIVDYEKLIDEIVGNLHPINHTLAVQLASIPEDIRGFGHVKERHLKAAKERERTLLASFRSPLAVMSAA